MKRALPFLAITAAAVLALPALAEWAAAPDVVMYADAATGACTQMPSPGLMGGGVELDMQCDTAPIRCAMGATDAGATLSSIKCIRSADDTAPVDTNTDGRFLCILPEAAGTTTCRIYRVVQ